MWHADVACPCGMLMWHAHVACWRHVFSVCYGMPMWHMHRAAAPALTIGEHLCFFCFVNLTVSSPLIITSDCCSCSCLQLQDVQLRLQAHQAHFAEHVLVQIMRPVVAAHDYDTTVPLAGCVGWTASTSGSLGGHLRAHQVVAYEI
jgi:hypothetical protein